MSKNKKRFFILSLCIGIQASGIVLCCGILEKDILCLIISILCFGLFAGLIMSYFIYLIDDIKQNHRNKIEELISKYNNRCKVIEDHCIERYNCKFDGEDLIFPYDGDDEDNCMASGYAEEYYTLKQVIKNLDELL